MAVMQWLKYATGGKIPQRYQLPELPPLIVIAPNMRAYQLWCRDHDLPPRSRLLYPVTRADRLRGIGPGRDVLWLWGPPYGTRELVEISRYMDVIRSRYGFNSEGNQRI